MNERYDTQSVSQDCKDARTELEHIRASPDADESIRSAADRAMKDADNLSQRMQQIEKRVESALTSKHQLNPFGSKNIFQSLRYTDNPDVPYSQQDIYGGSLLPGSGLITVEDTMNVADGVTVDGDDGTVMRSLHEIQKRVKDLEKARWRNALRKEYQEQLERLSPRRPQRPYQVPPQQPRNRTLAADPHNTGHGMQLRFNLGGMKGLPHGVQTSNLNRGLNAAYGRGQISSFQQRLGTGSLESIQGKFQSEAEKMPGPRPTVIQQLPEVDRAKQEAAAAEKANAERINKQLKDREDKNQSVKKEKKAVDTGQQGEGPPDKTKKPDPPKPPPDKTPPPKNKESDARPDPGGDSGGGESKPAIPYGPHHGSVGGSSTLRRQLETPGGPTLAERMLAAGLAGFRTSGYESGDDWGSGGYNPHMNGDPEEGGSRRAEPGQGGHPDDSPHNAPPNPPLAQRIVAMRLTKYGEPGYESGDDWGAGGYNPHMNGDPDRDESGGSGESSGTTASGPTHGPDPDDPWSGGGYNPHYQPWTGSTSAVQKVTIRRT